MYGWMNAGQLNYGGHVLDAWIVVPAILLFAALGTWMLRKIWAIRRGERRDRSEGR